MSQTRFVRALVALLRQEAPKGFGKVWLYCYMAGGGATIMSFYQLSAEPSAYRGLTFSWDGGDVVCDLFNKLHSGCHKSQFKDWTTATFVLLANGEYSLEFGNESLENTLELCDKWVSRHMCDLRFVRDKYNSVP